jgi:CRP-like cAMP-binding protein
MERLLALREVPIFARLRLDQLESIHRAMRDETYVRGELIVREGEPGHELYLLLEGEVEVWAGWGGPNPKLLNRLSAVSSFGEMAVLDDETRTATIVVAKDARVASLAGDRLKDLVFTMPEIAFEIFREIIARVRRAERRLAGGEPAADAADV